MSAPKRKRVILECRRGIVDPVSIPAGVEVEFRDYDYDNGFYEPEELERDEEGRRFRRSIWRKQRLEVKA